MTPLNLTVIGAALLSFGSAALAGKPIDERRPMDANGLVSIDLINGSVRITGTKTNEFRISGEIGDDVEEYELRETAGGIHFEEDVRHGNSNNNGWDWWNCWGKRRYSDCDLDGRFSRLEIEMPESGILRLEGVNGDVSVTGLTNNSNVSIVNGALTLQSLGGTIKADTVNGPLDAERLTGRISLETVNGEINDRDSAADRVDYQTVNGDVTSNIRSAEITAETVNGDIELTLGSSDELDVTSVGGRIDVATALADSASVEISSVNGRINLTIPTDSSARVEVNTEVNGRITNQLTDDQPEREDRYVNSSSLDFVMNGGRADIDISTVSGNVMLRGR